MKGQGLGSRAVSVSTARKVPAALLPRTDPSGDPSLSRGEARPPIVHEEVPACLSLTAGRPPAVALARGPRPLSPGFASVEADSLPLGPRAPLLLGPGLRSPGRSAGAHVAP